MESATNKKLYPDLMNSKEALENQTNEFRVDNHFWMILESDPFLKKEFENLIEEKANLRLQELVNQEVEKLKNSILDDIKKKGFEEGFNFGMQEGLKKANEKIEEFERTVSFIFESLKNAKAEILKKHESSWIAALDYVLKRALIPKASEILERVSLWLEEQIKSGYENMRLIIYLSSEDYAKVSVFILEHNKNWEIREDPSLISGDIRIDTEFGGVLLSSQKNIKELDEILNSIH